MGTPFKERLNAAAVERLAGAIRQSWPQFPTARFVARSVEALPELELMARVVHIAEVLAACLPEDFGRAASCLVGALGEPAPVDAPEAATREGEGARGFLVLPLTRWVAARGLAHPTLALDALGEMTSRFSAEFDVRPFIEAHPELTWARLRAWAEDPEPHRRRLASEGPRPYLPWGRRVKSLIADPEPGLAILETLRSDETLYVRRSVANHLNDVARHCPERVVEIAGAWWVEAVPVGARRAREQMVRHGLRGLLKRAHPGALSVVGLDPESPVAVRELTAAAEVALGGQLPWRFVVDNPAEAPARVRLDYLLDRPMAKGRRATRVCQIAERTLAPGASAVYDLHHSFKKVTTRTDYPGAHSIEVRVNGIPRARVAFVVTAG